MKKLLTALLFSLFALSFAHAEEAPVQAEKKIVLKVRNIDGVISTKASIKDGTVTVVEDPKVPDEQLINAIHKLKYTVEVLK